MKNTTTRLDLRLSEMEIRNWNEFLNLTLILIIFHHYLHLHLRRNRIRCKSILFTDRLMQRGCSRSRKINNSKIWTVIGKNTRIWMRLIIKMLMQDTFVVKITGRILMLLIDNILMLVMLVMKIMTILLVLLENNHGLLEMNLV